MLEPEFIGGEVNLRINIYQDQINANGAKSGVDGDELAAIEELDQIQKLLRIVASMK